MAVPGTFDKPRAKRGGKLLTLHSHNVLMGADDIVPDQGLNGVVRALVLVQELDQINHGGNFRLGRTHRGRWGKTHGNAIDAMVSSVGHNAAVCSVHVNPAGVVEARGRAPSFGVTCRAITSEGDGECLRVWFYQHVCV